MHLGSTRFGSKVVLERLMNLAVHMMVKRFCVRFFFRSAFMLRCSLGHGFSLMNDDVMEDLSDCIYNILSGKVGNSRQKWVFFCNFIRQIVFPWLVVGAPC
jgi:hypothetical protein